MWNQLLPMISLRRSATALPAEPMAVAAANNVPATVEYLPVADIEVQYTRRRDSPPQQLAKQQHQGGAGAENQVGLAWQRF
jgi:hypothetical protein